jgi:uncharacterized DUF497 family protein
MLVEFEFDEAKSQANKSKHSIDFVEAQALWLDEMLWKYRLAPKTSRVSWS